MACVAHTGIYSRISHFWSMRMLAEADVGPDSGKEISQDYDDVVDKSSGDTLLADSDSVDGMVVLPAQAAKRSFADEGMLLQTDME